MQTMIDPELMIRIETDIKLLAEYCRTLLKENTALTEKNRALEQHSQAVQDSRLMAIEHAKGIIEELTIAQGILVDEHSR